MVHLTTHSTHYIYDYVCVWIFGTGVHDRRALQQLALNVHVKHSDLT